MLLGCLCSSAPRTGKLKSFKIENIVIPLHIFIECACLFMYMSLQRYGTCKPGFYIFVKVTVSFLLTIDSGKDKS